MMDYAEALRFLRGRIERDGHLVGVAAGSGITAKYAVAGGCDLVLALSSGKYRQMGCSSMAGFLCYANSNDLVMDYALRELMRPCAGVPLLFGLNAADPTRAMYDYIREIKRMGFTGVVNYPTAGMMDGRFRAALEAEGAGYEREVEAIRFAHYCGLLTVAYVFDPAQARAMASAGADVVCAHFGLTSGGVLGAKHVLSLERARRTADEIFEAAAEVSPGILRLVYGGPVTTPQDAQYMYRGSTCQGYIGGSAFERIPVESAVMEVTRSFKQSPSIEPRSQLERILFSDPRNYDYIEFVREYIAENYMGELSLTELAQTAHLSVSYLSSLFRREVGRSFREYLLATRMEKARELAASGEHSLVEIAQLVGYRDYAQFSKMYKKYHGVSPSTDSQSAKKHKQQGRSPGKEIN